MKSPVSQRLITHFKGTVPKHSEFPEANEDKLRACDARQVYVLSDGASESYNSSLWAEIIVDAWFTSPVDTDFASWLTTVIKEYELRSDTANLSWSQEAAFERGSFASLLSLTWEPEADLRVTAVGDSIVILIADGRISWSYPYSAAEQFRNRPHLLPTILSKNLTSFFDEAVDSVPFQPGKGERLLCVTDALGEWLLRKCDDHVERLQRILNLASVDAFVALVDESRAAGTMRRDDTTLLILGEATDGTTDP